ncbi:hypothetical protein PR048_013506 [Dryococelus australis]|uniref:Uncharacterized protein n=1 Tax=Dryococelus australis TaxID=614101 RepID=A0ABQ9HSI3_9NEOP|nr:hypothetical protein PR048_013506 [Dryococelus australis]
MKWRRKSRGGDGGSCKGVVPSEVDGRLRCFWLGGANTDISEGRTRPTQPTLCDHQLDKMIGQRCDHCTGIANSKVWYRTLGERVMLHAPGWQTIEVIQVLPFTRVIQYKGGVLASVQLLLLVGNVYHVRIDRTIIVVCALIEFALSAVRCARPLGLLKQLHRAIFVLDYAGGSARDFTSQRTATLAVRDQFQRDLAVERAYTQSPTIQKGHNNIQAQQPLQPTNKPKYILKHPEAIPTFAGDIHENVEKILDTYNTASDINRWIELHRRIEAILWVWGCRPFGRANQLNTPSGPASPPTTQAHSQFWPSVTWSFPFSSDGRTDYLVNAEENSADTPHCQYEPVLNLTSGHWRRCVTMDTTPFFRISTHALSS